METKKISAIDDDQDVPGGCPRIKVKEKDTPRPLRGHRQFFSRSAHPVTQEGVGWVQFLNLNMNSRAALGSSRRYSSNQGGVE